MLTLTVSCDASDKSAGLFTHVAWSESTCHLFRRR